MWHPVFKRMVVIMLLAGSATAIGALGLTQIAEAGETAKFTNPLGDTSFEGIIKTMIRYMLGLVGLLALGALVWGGILYIVSLGNDAYVKQAKTIIFWAIVGLIVVTLAFVIISMVSGFLGVSAGNS